MLCCSVILVGTTYTSPTCIMLSLMHRDFSCSTYFFTKNCVCVLRYQLKNGRWSVRWGKWPYVWSFGINDKLSVLIINWYYITSLRVGIQAGGLAGSRTDIQALPNEPIIHQYQAAQNDVLRITDTDGNILSMTFRFWRRQTPLNASIALALTWALPATDITCRKIQCQTEG